MANPDNYVAIKGKNQMGSAVKGAKKDIQSLGDTAKKTGRVFLQAFEIGSAVAILKKLIKETKEWAANITDPEVTDAFSSIKESTSEIKTTFGSIMTYSLKPLFQNIAGGLENAKENIKTVMTYVGATVSNLPEIMGIAFKTIKELFKRTFDIDNIKTMAVDICKNIGMLLLTSLKNVFLQIPAMIWQLVSGAVEYIGYLALALKNKILEGVESAINGAINILPNWMKKLFGIDTDGKAVSLNINHDGADAQKQKAIDSFSSIGTIASGMFADIGDAWKYVGENVSETMSDIYGGVIGSAASEIKDLVNVSAGEIKAYAEKQQEDKSKKESMLGTTWTNMLDQLKNGFSGLIDMVKNPVWTLVQKAVSGFMNTVQPMIDSVLAPLFDVLTAFGESIGNAIIPVLEQLAPIIKWVAKLFMVLSSPIQYLADLIGWLGSWIAWLIGKFSGENVAKPGKFSSDAFSGLQGRLANLDGYAATGTSATASSSSASYQGATSVTINIYQQAPVVGDTGMRAFAKMIRNEFDALNYYGVA